MVLIVLVIIAVVLINVGHFFLSDYPDGGEIFVVLITTVVLGFGVLAVSNILHHSNAVQNDNVERVDVVQTELSALNNSSNVSGEFFLGFGSVDNEEVYRYIIQDSDGGYRVRSVDASDVVVYEIPGASSAYVETARLRSPSSWSAISNTSSDDIKFYVPEGSVKQDTYEVSVD